MNVGAGPPLPQRTRRKKATTEVRLLRRDGLRKYLRILRHKWRFDRAVQRLEPDGD